ncbi:MAG: hypothetical protein WCE52_10545 [Candidatus Acidiferrum sp.]
MTKFGRFEFGKEEPSEIYEGDHLKLEKEYIKVIEGPALLDEEANHVVAVIHLDRGQSVRKINKKQKSAQ